MEIENTIVVNEKKQLEENNIRINGKSEIIELDTLNLQNCETCEIIEWFVRKRQEKEIQIQAYINLLKKLLCILKENKYDIILLLKENNYFDDEYNSYYKEYLELLDKYSVLHQKNNNEELEKENDIIVVANDKQNLDKNINIGNNNEINELKIECNKSKNKEDLKRR